MLYIPRSLSLAHASTLLLSIFFFLLGGFRLLRAQETRALADLAFLWYTDGFRRLVRGTVKRKLRSDCVRCGSSSDGRSPGEITRSRSRLLASESEYRSYQKDTKTTTPGGGSSVGGAGTTCVFPGQSEFIPFGGSIMIESNELFIDEDH
uniref:Putative secreted protein n=1 Tax=Anopheles darlingi TaxID=43151 RepID=A0A2M4DMM3_ANODA